MFIIVVCIYFFPSTCINPAYFIENVNKIPQDPNGKQNTSADVSTVFLYFLFSFKKIFRHTQKH